MTQRRPLPTNVPFYAGPTYRPPKPIRLFTPESHEGSQSSNSSEITNSNMINLDFKDNSPFYEGVVSKAYQRPDNSFFQEP